MIKSVIFNDKGPITLEELANKYFEGDATLMRHWMATTFGDDKKSMVTVLAVGGIDALAGHMALLKKPEKPLEISAP